jgi:hypothetical protein
MARPTSPAPNGSWPSCASSSSACSSKWDPRGNALGIDDIPGYRQGISRSDFNDDVCRLEVAVRAASGHQLIAASAEAKSWLERITGARSRGTDLWFGRRTGMRPEDAPGLLAGLLRKFS